MNQNLPSKKTPDIDEILNVFLNELQHYLANGNDREFLVAFIQTATLSNKVSNSNKIFKTLVERYSPKFLSLSKQSRYQLFVKQISQSNIVNQSLANENLVSSFRNTINYANSFENAVPKPEDLENLKYKRSEEQKRLEEKSVFQNKEDAKRWMEVEKWLNSRKVSFKKKPQKENLITKNIIKPVQEIGHRIKRSFQKSSLGRSISNTRSGKPNRWNGYKSSLPVQLVVQTANIIPSIAKTSLNIAKGSSTGLLLAIPMMAINPAGALIAFATGTTIGAIKNTSDEGFKKTDLRTYNPNTPFSNSKRLSLLAKSQIRSALNNPQNMGVRINDISNPAVQKFLLEEKILTNNKTDPSKIEKKYRGKRVAKKIVNTASIGALGFLAGTAFGIGLPLSIVAATSAMAMKYFVDQGKETTQFLSIAESQKGYRSPGISVTGQKSIFRPFSKKSSEQEETQRWIGKLPPIVKGIANITNQISINIGIPSPVTLLSKIMIRWNRLNPLLKYAPIIAPVSYLLGGPIFGYQLLFPRFLLSIGIGLGAGVAGSLSLSDQRFEKRYKKEKFLTDFALGSSGFLQKINSSFLGSLIRSSMPFLGILGNVLGVVGVYKFFQTAWDLINHGISKLGDYAKVTGLAITLITSITVFKQFYEDMMVQAPKPETTETVTSIYMNNFANQTILASSAYDLPKITYTCSGNDALYISPENMKVEDKLIIIDEQGNEKSFIKTTNGIQDFEYKNLVDINPDIKIDTVVEKGTIVGKCID